MSDPQFDREQLAEAIWEAAVGAMPPWQAKLFRRMLKAVAQGKLPRTIHWPPRGTLPAITVHQPPRRRPKRTNRLAGRRARQLLLF